MTETSPPDPLSREEEGETSSPLPRGRGARGEVLKRAAVAIAASFFLGGCPAPTSTAPDAGDGAPSAEARKPDAAAAALTPDASVDEALPPSQSDEMTMRVKHLLEAIAHDNPDLATDILFPRDAYLGVRDSADPGKAWEAKVVGPFRKSVHALHKRTKGIEKAQFVSFDLGQSVVQSPPKKREYKRPLWRVKHSRLTITVDGRTQRIEIGEMTGWHGACFVTKLR